MASPATPPPARRRGFTLAELMIAMGVFLVIGAIVFLVFNAGLTLFTKNVAANTVHNEGRSVIQRITTDVTTSPDAPVMATVVAPAGSSPITSLTVTQSAAQRYLGEFNAQNVRVSLRGSGAQIVPAGIEIGGAQSGQIAAGGSSSFNWTIGADTNAARWTKFRFTATARGEGSERDIRRFDRRNEVDACRSSRTAFAS